MKYLDSFMLWFHSLIANGSYRDNTVYDCFVNIFLFEIVCIMYIILFLNLLLLQHVHGEEVVDVDEQGEVTTEFPTEPPVEMMKVRKR